MTRRKLRVGMVGGGGPSSFFGAPHRRAILMDNSAELTAGALRSHPDESLAAARELFFSRGYPDWKTMIDWKQPCPKTTGSITSRSSLAMTPILVPPRRPP